MAITPSPLKNPKRVCKTQRFLLFPKLPAEIRLRIWALVHLQPRLVPVRCGADMSNPSTRSGCSSPSPPPATLHVCSESRAEALKIYRPSFGFARSPASVFFSPERDILYFGPKSGWMAASAQFNTFMAMSDPADLARVRRLAVSDAVLCYHPGAASFPTIAGLDLFFHVIHRMPAVVELLIVPLDGPHEPKVIWTRIMRQIASALCILRDQFPNWCPPRWAICPLSDISPPPP